MQLQERVLRPRALQFAAQKRAFCLVTRVDQNPQFILSIDRCPQLRLTGETV